MTAQAIADISLVGHLMRRAAFGAPAAALEVYMTSRYEDVVDELLEPERFPRQEEDLLERSTQSITPPRWHGPTHCHTGAYGRFQALSHARQGCTISDE